MAKLLDRFQPSFSLFPLNNNRTGYQPVNIPLLLVVPYVRSQGGIPIHNANVCELIFFIEDAPGKVPVAAPANIGLFHPDYERFRITISNSQLADVRIDPEGRRFFDANGNEKDFVDVVDGDLMEYTMLRGPIGAFGKSSAGPADTIPFYKNAEYYDLSPFIIETVDLPVGKYNFVYQARYFRRIVSADNEFVCIDDSQKVLARFANFINHPGDLHEAMIKNTPAFYFDSASKDKDSTIAFYRPFADALQDIFDEQELLKGVNFVDKIPAQYIPYLAYLLGLDMPYFTSTTDDIRKALLRNGRKLQQLKGSKRAIRELFEIFGFTIDIANLWYSLDGKRFIAPGEQLPEGFADQEIGTTTVCHAEPLLNNYSDPGFGQLSIPLLFRPLSNITVDGWLVEEGSAADVALKAAVDATAANVETFEASRCALTPQGFQSTTSLQNTIPSGGVLGRSTILVDPSLGGIAEAQVGLGKPLSQSGLKYNKDDNFIDVVFDHFLNFENGTKLYVFATYERTKIILPPALADLRSNRFDINILLFKNGEQPTSDIFQFLLEFLFKFKAFHSLLRKITFTIEVDDIYNVTDFCVGGTQAQSPFSAAGQLQTPPPVIPILPNSDGEIECSDEGIRAGAKDKDIKLRSKILSLLEQEHAAWKNLDDSHQIPSALLPILQSASRVNLRRGDSGSCEFTQFGQDRIIDSGLVDFDHVADTRAKLCSLDGNTLDYCYKGRVQQELDTNRTLLLEEIFRVKPCTLTAGIGTYYMTQLVSDSEFSGGDLGTNAADLTDVANINRSRHDQGYVRIMAFENPQIHYTDRVFLDDLTDTINNRFFATRKPSLEVIKDNLGKPGHRFISMANLRNTFVHPNYLFRPWDYLFDIVCPEDLPDNVIVPDLNAHLVKDVNGDDILSIDPFPLVYYGNNIYADIPQMNDHTLSPITPNNVTHSIWSSASPGMSFMNQAGTISHLVIDQATDGLRYSVEALDRHVDTICFTDILGPIFESANRDCVCDDIEDSVAGRSLEDIFPEVTGITGGTGTSIQLTGGADFIDGYPADFGFYSVDLRLFDFPREGLEGYGFSVYGVSRYGVQSTPAASGPSLALGIPFNGQNQVELFFKVGSEIKLTEESVDFRYYQPYRMDCGCSLYECPPAAGTDVTAVTGTGVGTGTGTGTDITGNDVFGVAVPGNHGVLNFGIGNFGGGLGGDSEPTPIRIDRCPLSLFQLDDGSFDWNPDRVILNPTMILNEQYGSTSCLMDGSIPNMMSFSDDKVVFSSILTAFEIFPQEGSYQFIDDYGIIHVGVFETLEDRLDITTQLRDPRVWGEPFTGEVRNFKTFRDGIVTTERQIIQVADFGFIIIAEGSDQKVERFQTSFGCGDEKFEDPFAFHLDANIVDGVNIIITPVEAAATDGLDGYGVGGFGEEEYGG